MRPKLLLLQLLQKQRLQCQRFHKRCYISSIGFSGAGFLAVYHLGVAACLKDQQILPSSSSISPKHRYDAHSSNSSNNQLIRLTGVSAGSLVAAALMAYVDPETDGMNAVLQISHTTRNNTGRLLDALQPGFSLIDVMETIFKQLLYNAIEQNYYNGPEQFLQSINSNNSLRIGLTDRRIFPPIGYNPEAFVYVDTYRDIDDIIAACVLSSYVPGVTGPALGNMAVKNHAVTRAALRLNEMIQHGCVKKGTTGATIQLQQHHQQQQQQHNTSTNQMDDSNNNNNTSRDPLLGREICWDGGLVNAFPTVDKETIIVSPIAADFTNNPSINPAIEYDTSYNNSENNNTSNIISHGTRTSMTGNHHQILGVQKIVLNPMVTVHVTAANVASVRYMVISSNDEILETKFIQGYNNAKQFLNHHGLISIHHHFISKLKKKTTPPTPTTTTSTPTATIKDI